MQPEGQTSLPTESTKTSPEQDGGNFHGYLESLDDQQLDHALNEVLEEIRKRELNQLRKDILSHSQSLVLQHQPK